MVRELLNKGADVNAQDHTGIAALMQAAREAHQLVLDELLANGADVHAVNDSGQTAFWMAAHRSLFYYQPVLSSLVARRADVNVKDKELELTSLGLIDSLADMLVGGAKRSSER